MHQTVEDSYFKKHPTQRFKMRPIALISIPQFNFVEKLQEKGMSFKGSLVELFQGKEAKLRYMYQKKHKPQIEAVLKQSVANLYKAYEEAVVNRIKELRIHCEMIRDSSFAEELGDIADVRLAKKQIEKLLEKNTEFSYVEKDFLDLVK